MVELTHARLAQECHGRAGAHGLSGILHTLLLACDYYAPADLYPGVPLLALIEQATLALAEEAFPSGNLPSSLGKEADRSASFYNPLRLGQPR